MNQKGQPNSNQLKQLKSQSVGAKIIIHVPTLEDRRLITISTSQKSGHVTLRGLSRPH